KRIVTVPADILKILSHLGSSIIDDIGDIRDST
ncbi:MAG: hypothetical protein HeimAB125_21470, partial [Candidatus Heimdallarchaeota archaeon AB_125]